MSTDTVQKIKAKTYFNEICTFKLSMNEKSRIFSLITWWKTQFRLHLCTLSQVTLVEFDSDILDRNKIVQHFLHKEAALLPAS